MVDFGLFVESVENNKTAQLCQLHPVKVLFLRKAKMEQGKYDVLVCMYIDATHNTFTDS